MQLGINLYIFSQFEDSIESDRDDDDDGSIDLGDNSSKRNSPIDHENQHLDHHNTSNSSQHHLSQHQTTAEQQQQLAAAIRQQLGAAINFAGTQNFLGQLTGGFGGIGSGGPTQQANHTTSGKGTIPLATQDHVSTNPNLGATTTDQQNGVEGNQAELLKQQQEQLLAALMAASNQQQQQQSQQQQQQQQQSALAPDQQAAAKAALSMVASNAMLIAAPNAPDAMAVAAAAQAIGVKGAFIILLL